MNNMIEFVPKFSEFQTSVINENDGFNEYIVVVGEEIVDSAYRYDDAVRKYEERMPGGDRPSQQVQLWQRIK